MEARNAVDTKRGRGRPSFASALVNLPMPPSMNALWRNVIGSGRVKTQAYRDWRDAAGWELRSQRPRAVPGPLSVAVLAGSPGEARRRDLDNLPKAILDLLVAHQVIEDDSHVVELVARWEPVVAAGRVLVQVRQCTDPRARLARQLQPRPRLGEQVAALGATVEAGI